MTRNVTLATLATLAALGLSARPAAAQQTLYNFEAQSPTNGFGYGGTNTLYTGPGQLGTGTTAVWNVFSGSSPNDTAARTSTGGASSVVFTSGATNTANGPNENNPASTDQLLSQFAYTSSTNRFSLTGLTPNAPFVLDLYGINGGNNSTGGSFNSRGTNFSLTDPTFTTVLQTKGTVNRQDQTFVAGDNYVQFTGTTSATGGVYGTYFGNPSVIVAGNSEPDFNGAQINVSAAPEPSEWAALGFAALGLGGLLWRAKKRRADAA